MKVNNMNHIIKGQPVIINQHRNDAHQQVTIPRRTLATGLMRLLLLVLLLLILTACGDRDEPTPTPSAATSTPLPTATVALEDTVMEVVTLEPTPVQSLADSTVPLIATANAAITSSAPVVVEESVDCPVEPDLDLAGYPDLEVRMGCPLEPAIYESVALNEFGPGPNYDRFMLWFGWEELIYVLFPDGHWETHSDTWTDEMPIFTCNPLQGDPESPPLPRRGFGKLWCDEPGLSDTMGFIDREERLCQHAVIQPFLGGRMIACFEDATIRYFQIFDDNTWALEQQP